MIYITRHGQTDWNVEKKVMGKRNIPLNNYGVKQAETIKNNISNTPINLIICSPLKRAKQTAQIINEVLQVQIAYDERISERDFGEFEGMNERDDFDFKGFWDYYRNDRYEKAENVQDFFQRIYSFLEEIKKDYCNKNIMLITHGGVSIAINCYFNKHIPKGTLVELELNNCEIMAYNFK